MKLLLALLLLLSLNKRWYLSNHIRGRTHVGRCKLSRCGSSALTATLGNESLSMQICAHYWHARVFTHLWRVSLQFSWKSYPWRSTVTNSTRHAKIGAYALVAHDILLRNITELSMVRRGETCMRSEFLLKRSFTTAETTTLLSLTWWQLGWVRCITCSCVI